MKRAFASLLMASVGALPFWGCAQANYNFATDGGADGAGRLEGGASSAASVDCPEYCAAAAERNAEDCGDTDKCEAACKADKRAASNKDCAAEWQAVVDCAAGQGTGGKPPGFSCDSKGKATSASCSSKKTALTKCLGSGTASDDAGPNVTPPASSSTCLTQPVDPSNPACDSCNDQYCCAQWNGCLDSLDCMNFVDCMVTCEGLPTAQQPACVDACVSTQPTGSNLYLTALNCMESNCSTQCQ